MPFPDPVFFFDNKSASFSKVARFARNPGKYEDGVNGV